MYEGAVIYYMGHRATITEIFEGTATIEYRNRKNQLTVTEVEIEFLDLE